MVDPDGGFAGDPTDPIIAAFKAAGGTVLDEVVITGAAIASTTSKVASVVPTIAQTATSAAGALAAQTSGQVRFDNRIMNYSIENQVFSDVCLIRGS